jgi:hypothetical protein
MGGTPGRFSGRARPLGRKNESHRDEPTSELVSLGRPFSSQKHSGDNSARASTSDHPIKLPDPRGPFSVAASTVSRACLLDRHSEAAATSRATSRLTSRSTSIEASKAKAVRGRRLELFGLRNAFQGQCASWGMIDACKRYRPCL